MNSTGFKFSVFRVPFRIPTHYIPSTNFQFAFGGIKVYIVVQISVNREQIARIKTVTWASSGAQGWRRWC